LPEPPGRMHSGFFTASPQSGRSMSPFTTCGDRGSRWHRGPRKDPSSPRRAWGEQNLWCPRPGHDGRCGRPAVLQPGGSPLLRRCLSAFLPRSLAPAPGTPLLLLRPGQGSPAVPPHLEQQPVPGHDHQRVPLRQVLIPHLLMRVVGSFCRRKRRVEHHSPPCCCPPDGDPSPTVPSGIPTGVQDVRQSPLRSAAMSPRTLCLCRL